MILHTNKEIGKKVFLYCMPNDPYFVALISRTISINLKEYPNADHIIYPHYGIRLYSSLASRMAWVPKFLKNLQHWLSYLKKDSELVKLSQRNMKPFLNDSEMQKLQYLSFSAWIMALIKAIWPNINRTKYQNAQKFITRSRLKKVSAGDLIADSYLRNRGVPNLNIKDYFFNDIVWRAYAIEELISNCIDKYEMVYCFSSYSTYIQDGIPLRLTVKKNCVGVTFFGATFIQFHKNLRSDVIPTHAGYFENYSIKLAEKLDPVIIKLAKKSLENRLQNIYDSSMQYMNNSKSKQGDDFFHFNNDECLVLMLHDFFDSPHIYQWSLFPDFYEWASTTLTFCDHNKIAVYVKPHPNQIIDDNATAIRNLKNLFRASEFIHWLPKDTNNSDIFKKNPNAIITCHGSIAVEACYAEIPVIMAGDSPTFNFDIGHTPKSIQEYLSIIKNHSSLKPGTKNDALLFTALHQQKKLLKKDSSLLRYLKATRQDINNNPQMLEKTDVINEIDRLLKKEFRDSTVF